jgi:xanthine dehydrogenase YagS FAD-binding subunit
MRPFEFTRADTARAAILAHGPAAGKEDAINATSQYLAGGTTLLDLMKLDVMRPVRVVDINGLQKSDLAKIEGGPKELRLGAMVRMAEAADHPDIKKNFPVIAQSLTFAASAQLRNMASLGGNVLQRTRCPYFRDTSYEQCNKRNPGSGCAALEGINRMHAVLGASDQCIATYPGDFAQALIALDSQIEIIGPKGTREIPFETLHRRPGESPNIETTLAPGELITTFRIPAMPFARRSLFLKIRDRESYEFALAAAAVALDLDGGMVKQARIALGGVATVPWRAREAEAQLKDKRLDDAVAIAAANAAFAQAKPREHNQFKIELGKRTLVRALRQAAALEI